VSSLPEHEARNRTAWDSWAPDWVASGRRCWAEAPSWGIWGIPEAELGLLADVAGRDVIELGCGTAYVSAWVARAGGRPVGIDLSTGQLATARSLQAEHGMDFPLLEGSATAVPLPDASFDVAISEYGACLWAEPEGWVAEAARLLRPGGRLIFLTNSWLSLLCLPEREADGAATDRLLRPARGLLRTEWPDGDGSVEFHLPPGAWIALLRRHGFVVEALDELYAPDDATGVRFAMDAEWARRWPAEEVWRARKAGG